MALAIVVSTVGMRVLITVAAMSVMSSLPDDRTSLGSALGDTGQEVGMSIGLAVAGVALAAGLGGALPAGGWTAGQAAAFEGAETVGCVVAAVLAGAAVFWGALRLPGR